MEDFVKSTQKTCTNKNWVIIQIDGDKIANVETEKKMETDWTKISTWEKVESNESTVYLRYTEELLQESVDANKRTW